MREGFVEDLLRMSMPQSKVAVRLQLKVLCWCTSEACKYRKEAQPYWRPRWLLSQVQHWALRGLLALLQERFVSK